MKTNATEPQARYLTFTPGEPNPKTLTWQVILKDQRSSIGKIRWYGPYRQYSFFPYAGTVFDQTRLSDLAKFLEHQTREHYGKARAVAPTPTPKTPRVRTADAQRKRPISNPRASIFPPTPPKRQIPNFTNADHRT